MIHPLFEIPGCFAAHMRTDSHSHGMFWNNNNTQRQNEYQDPWMFFFQTYVVLPSKMSLKSVKLNFQFSVWLYKTCTHHLQSYLYNRPHWNWSVGSNDTDSWIVTKTIGNKADICFVWLHLKFSICKLWLICLITSHISISSESNSLLTFCR